MKFSKEWLQEWIDIKLSTEKLVAQLTMSGLEVDAVIPVANEFSKVVVAEVLEVKPHPNADKLRICKVNIGNDIVEIICGAANVSEKMKVPAALLGAEFPDNFKIKKAKLRGVESSGMICSAKELGLAETSTGIMELSVDAPVGVDFREYLKLNDDQTIDIDLTPNRGDCTSIAGIAREVATLNRCKYIVPKINSVKPTCKDTFSIKLTAQEACPRYVGRVIRNINTNATTPLWLQERLRRCGIRSIDPVVDVTNYVLLELGQPMHAFDLAKLTENIEIRFAKPKEKLVLLSDDKVTLTPETLVIADAEKPLAIAGVMGGKESGVTAETKDIFLESAFFEPIQITKSARCYGLQTDSSYRFERGVDFQLQEKAMERATQLLLEIVGGEAGPICEKHSAKHLPKQKTIKLRPERIEKILGLKIPDKTAQDILIRLGMEVVKNNQAWSITVPSFRFDCNIEVDLVEEVARVYGYEKIPAHAYKAALHVPLMSAAIIPLKRLRFLLQDRDYHEIITYSFIDEKEQKLLDPSHEAIPLVNPIASNMAVMRTNLWPGLLNTLIYNLHRQQNRVRLFETGLRFYKKNKKIEQQKVMSGLIYGSVCSEQWGVEERQADFFDIKADIEALLSLTEELADFEFRPATHPALHPGKSAEIFRRNQSVGQVGALHPSVAHQMGFKKPVYLFELLLEGIQQKTVPSYQPISKFPAIRRDLAFVVDKQISAQTISATISQKVGNLLVNLSIFDIYQGENIELNKKSVALALTLQHSSRTLNDNEVNRIVEDVIALLKDKLGAKLRH
jgi:phenylalanyl-tRNA synthetase beta chain